MQATTPRIGVSIICQTISWGEEVEEVQLIKVNAILKAGPKGNRDVVFLRESKTYYFM